MNISQSLITESFFLLHLLMLPQDRDSLCSTDELGEHSVFNCPACINKVILICALMLHPPMIHPGFILSFSFICQHAVGVPTLSQGRNKVRLSPVCEVRKENFSTCDCSVKLFLS